QLLSEFNNTDLAYPFEKTIHEIFEEQAQRAPEQVAVVYEQDKLTYKELNQRANQLARYLREKGVKEESIVGIMMDRSLEMMISILGVLKAGGAYLPIDKTYPKDRVDFMLQDTNTQWVLCQKDVENTLRENNVSIITLDDSEIYKQETSNPNYNITGKTLAYIIYTSGTTGKPKGILTTHLNVIRIAKENLYLDINENY
ncbi:AMP-binding protein, partial [Lysinibacillus sphaericus]|uniref:AMP-binding protein n=1 Tax=Lysinibacillus sphaericus TaxID=1421 RepID=UPI002E22A72D|nr:AMP-binding protein [Lysinibacillus sphaericus]